jgi:hypothetical protein
LFFIIGPTFHKFLKIFIREESARERKVFHSPENGVRRAAVSVEILIYDPTQLQSIKGGKKF